MELRPSTHLSEQQVQAGIKLVIKDGLATEAMTTLTGGAFLVSMALLMGASNFQIGVLAALPTFTNIFQLLSIWLVRKYRSRRAIAVICSVLARFPLLLIGTLPLLFSSSTTIKALIFFLFFFYFFGSVAGPTWNAWMKDLVPEKILGTYFSRRSRLTQTLNVVMSLLVAITIDFVKRNYPSAELVTYACMFIAGGLIGLCSAYFLSRTPEPPSGLTNGNILRLFRKPLQDPNFRNLLVFNSAWVFAINMATPFFFVYMMKTIGLALSYVIALGILSQLSSILSLKLWGGYADNYSNKTIIAIGAPLYIVCIVGWCFVGQSENFSANIILLSVINIITGFATAGINLSLTNIGLKLAPKQDAIVYLSAKNIVTALFSSIAPVFGGWLADILANSQFNWTLKFKTAEGMKELHVIALGQWNFLFLIGALLALISIKLLKRVQETGEVEKTLVVKVLRSDLRNSLKENFVVSYLINWPVTVSARIKKLSFSSDKSKAEETKRA